MVPLFGRNLPRQSWGVYISCGDNAKRERPCFPQTALITKFPFMLATKVQTAKSDISDIKIVYFKRKLQIGSATEISTPAAVGKKNIVEKAKVSLTELCGEIHN